MMEEEKMSFPQEFLINYEKFIKTFDEIAQDSMKGHEMEKLTKEFQANNKKELICTTNKFVINSEYPNCSNNEAINEDFSIINNESNIKDLNNENKILANLYRRFCQATHLRVTFNEARHNKQDDRMESLYYGRLAIRLNPDDFFVNSWYMCSIGWLSDSIKAVKEKTVVGRLYRNTCLRCIRLNRNDFLAHNLLGRYYYHVAELSWIERKIAKTFLGADDLDDTFLDAEREFRIAHELRDWVPTGFWMARVLLAQKRPYEEILKWINYGLQMECDEPTSEIDKKKLIELDMKLKQQYQQKNNNNNNNN